MRKPLAPDEHVEPKPGFEPGGPELQAQVHTICAFRRVQAGVNPARVIVRYIWRPIPAYSALVPSNQEEVGISLI